MRHRQFLSELITLMGFFLSILEFLNESLICVKKKMNLPDFPLDNLRTLLYKTSVYCYLNGDIRNESVQAELLLLFLVEDKSAHGLICS
jgi:hypothetical protein